MSLLSSLATLVGDEFKDVLPAVNAVVADMATNYLDWQSNPVVKSTEAVTTLVNPVAAIDMQAVIGAASLVQALWQVFGAGQKSGVAQSVVSANLATAAAGVATPVTLQAQIAASGQAIPTQQDPQPSHM